MVFEFQGIVFRICLWKEPSFPHIKDFLADQMKPAVFIKQSSEQTNVPRDDFVLSFHPVHVSHELRLELLSLAA